MSEKHLPIDWKKFTVEADSGSLSADLWGYLKSSQGEAVLAKMREVHTLLVRQSQKEITAASQDAQSLRQEDAKS